MQISNVRSINLLQSVLPVLVILAFMEFVSSRIVGRLAFMFAGNPVLIATYQLGVLGVYAASSLALASLVLFALAFLGSRHVFAKMYGVLCLVLAPVALLAFSYAYSVVILLVIMAPLHMLLYQQQVDRYAVLSVGLVSVSFLLVALTTFLGAFPVFRLLGEVSVVLASVSLFLSLRGHKRISWKLKAVSIVLPVVVLVVPHYASSSMPWLMRQVTTFSVNFQMVMPVEAYAVALALYLATIFRLSGNKRLTRYGLLLLLIGGLPQWNVYPLLLSFIGIITTVISFLPGNALAKEPVPSVIGDGA